MNEEKKDFEEKLKELEKKQKESKPKVNIDGKEIDYDVPLEAKINYESAKWSKRLIAFIFDILLVITIWTLLNINNFKTMFDFVKSVSDKMIDSAEVLEKFKLLYYQFYTKLILYLILTTTLYYTLIPALLGKGKTFGKLICSLGVIRYGTDKEPNPTRLVLRELVGRSIIEYTLALPFIVNLFFNFSGFTQSGSSLSGIVIAITMILPLCVSIILSLARKDSRSLHDLISGTVVIQADFFGEDYDQLDQEIIEEKQKKLSKKRK